MLELCGSESEKLSLCGFFKRNCLGLQKFLPLTQSLLGFAAEVVGTYLPSTGILIWGLDVGLEFLAPELSLWNFYPAHSVSAPLLPVWMDVVF